MLILMSNFVIRFCLNAKSMYDIISKSYYKRQVRNMSKEFEEKVLSILEEHSIALKTINEHTKIIGEHSKTLDEHTKTLDVHTKILDEHTKILNEHTRILNEHTKTLNEHTRILNEHTKTLNEHTRILNEHSKDLAEIKKYLLVLEDKISNELPALFDGFSMNIEKTSEIEFKQKATDKKVEFNSIKISNLEKVSKMHDKQLKKLASH